MNKFIKVCLVTCAGLIGTGLIFGLIGVSMGGVAMANGTYVSWDEGEMFDHEDSFEHVERIQVEMDYGKVLLEACDGDQVLVHADKVSSHYVCKSENGVLRIEDKERRKRLFGINKEKKELIIQVPRELEWESAELTIGAGEMTAEDLRAGKVEIDVGAGEFYGINIQASEELDMENGVGSISLEKIETEKLDINCGIGGILVDGKINGDSYIKNGIGSVELTVSGKQRDYNYQVGTGIGSVKINGNSFGELSASTNLNNGADKTFQIDCGIGRIDLYLD